MPHSSPAETQTRWAARSPSVIDGALGLVVDHLAFFPSIPGTRLCRSGCDLGAVGFFHPYTDGGGGGKRVLWCAVRSVQEENPDLHCAFTVDDASPKSLAARALDRFSYPLAWIFGCKVICYTHYPTISSDMVSRVLQSSSMYNNDSLTASRLYGLVGSSAHLAMVNSLRTRSHIDCLWKIPQRTERVYPPCDTSSLQIRWAATTTLLSSLLSLVLFSAVAAVISGRRGRRTAVGFFHPYTNDGGGGERVLWCFVRAMQEEKPDLDCAVFTVDDASPQSLAARGPLSWLYGSVGSCAHLAMANSSWTRSHIDCLWKIPQLTKRVHRHPPRDTSSLQRMLPLGKPVRSPVIISVAQFRPEKIRTCLGRSSNLWGGCRNKQDEERLQKLKERCRELNLDKFVEFRGIVEETSVVSGAANVADFFPALRRLGWHGPERKLAWLQRTRDALIGEFIKRHRFRRRRSGSNGEAAVAIGNGDKGRATVIDVMLSLQESDPGTYTDVTIKGLIAEILAAGIDTSAVTMERAMCLLLIHPEVLHAARAELDAKIGQGRMAEEDIPNLPFLNFIINETLRLYPAVPLLMPHESSQDCTVGGYDVPHGTMLLANAWAIHRDPNTWDKPQEFKPERFQCEGGKEEAGLRMLPFGSGRRKCPGESLAMRVIGLALVTLIHCSSGRSFRGRR
ncbi:cytochrome P450 [Musa troglodytarum]|uniref:Cytochrome P450 n=1 Tax=Musa troglodytarum TaxID=320322 RepID=A0A9E7I4H6_9LILI|nr:cytochrome P450 [Musa troglodytarum]